MQRVVLKALLMALMLPGCVGNTSGLMNANTSKTSAGDEANGSNSNNSVPLVDDISGLADGPLAAFVQRVWAPTASQDCLACHVTKGYAPSQGSAFMLQPPSQPGYLQANQTAFSTFARRQVNGKSYLLQKVTNQIPHGGGVRMQTTDARYQGIDTWLQASFAASDLALADSKLKAMRLRDAIATLRRASVQLAQRQPTAQEAALAQQGNLDSALDSVLASPGFGSFVWKVYNGYFSFSTFLAGNFVASDRMDGGLFTHDQRYWWGTAGFSNNNGESAKSENSVAYQAENLAVYLVQNNRPFTEMVTANYFMANPYGARTYGVFDKVTWQDPNNANEFQAIPASSVQTASGVPFPMSGVLTLESLMNTYSTTASNRNRKRARYVYSIFLNTDIMGLAQSPPDLAKIIASSDPNKPATMNNLACVSCHTLLDQVASDFANYSPYGAYATNPNDIYPPVPMGGAGFEGVPVPSTAATRLSWLGSQIAQDPRFADAIVSQWLLALTGNPPLRDPRAGATRQEEIAAKLYQEQVLSGIASAFRASNYNLKTVVKQLIESPYYRAVDANVAVSPSDAVMLNSLVNTHWRGSADLTAGLQAGMGTPWVTDRVYGDTLNQEYAALMTGADATGFSARITSIMGSNMACFAFYSARYGYFTGAPWMLPQAVTNAEDPNSTTGAEDIQQAIATLIAMALPLDTATAAVEQDATWKLYQQVYSTALANPDATPEGCIGGRLLPYVKATDEAWIAVLTYVLSDPELLFE